MPKTEFPVIPASFGQIFAKNDFHKNGSFYIWSDAARRADSKYHLSFSSKRDMEA